MAVRVNANGERLFRTANLPASNAVSACLWLYYDTFRSTFLCPPIFHDMAPSTTSYQGLSFQTTGELALYDQAGGTNFASSPATGSWSFLAFTRSGSALKGYFYTLSGTLTTVTRTYATTFTPTNLSFLGNGFSTSQWVNGRAAACKLWDVGLTDAEIEAERHTILPRKWESLNEFWPCFPGATERLAGYSKGRDFTGGGTLTDEQGPPISWGGAPIIIGAAAAQPAYTQTKYQFFNDDGDLAAA